MPAHKGNQDWKKRSKHGRDLLFKTPDLLWKECVKYFKMNAPWIEKKPMVVSTGNNQGSEVEMIDVPRMVPLTMQGLCFFLHCNIDYFNHFKRSNKDEGFSSVIADIETIVYDHKLKGAAAGFFNANIISRDLGLRDATDITSKGHSIAPLPESVKNASLDELRNLLDKEDNI